MQLPRNQESPPMRWRMGPHLHPSMEEDFLDMAFVECSEVNRYFNDQSGVCYMRGALAVSKLRMKCEDCKAAIQSPTIFDLKESKWIQKMSRRGLSYPTPILCYTLRRATKYVIELGGNLVKMKNPIEAALVILLQKSPRWSVIPVYHKVATK